MPGGFAAVYRVLAAAEEAGRVRRGYFVEGLGAAQFGAVGAIDRLRAQARPLEEGPGEALVLAATDPANPYGAALAWPRRGATDRRRHHMPIIGIGKREPVDKVFIPRDQTVADVLVHQRPRTIQLFWLQIGPILKHVLDPFVVDLVRPPGPKQVRKGQMHEQVP